MIVGPFMWGRALHGGVEPGGDQGVLETVPLGIVVVDVVGCDYRSTPRSRASPTEARVSSASPCR